MGDVSRSFSMKEFACPCGECGINYADLDLIWIIQDVVDHFTKVFPKMHVCGHINSGSRCKEHNKAVGGSESSQHLLLGAADFYLYDKNTGVRINPDLVAKYLMDTYPNSLGIGQYKGRTHVDNRYDRAYRWDYR